MRKENRKKWDNKIRKRSCNPWCSMLGWVGLGLGYITRGHVRFRSPCTFLQLLSLRWTGSCQLYYMEGNDTGGLYAYLGQYYELQDNTFSLTSPVYVTRANASIWLYYNFDEGRWELGDRISDVNVVVHAFSSNTSTYDAPPAVSDWTFPAENTTVYGVTLSCTCKWQDQSFIQSINHFFIARHIAWKSGICYDIRIITSSSSSTS